MNGVRREEIDRRAPSVDARPRKTDAVTNPEWATMERFPASASFHCRSRGPSISDFQRIGGECDALREKRRGRYAGQSHPVGLGNRAGGGRDSMRRRRHASCPPTSLAEGKIEIWPGALFDGLSDRVNRGGAGTSSSARGNSALALCRRKRKERQNEKCRCRWLSCPPMALIRVECRPEARKVTSLVSRGRVRP